MCVNCLDSVIISLMQHLRPPPSHFDTNYYSFAGGVTDCFFVDTALHQILTPTRVHSLCGFTFALGLRLFLLWLNIILRLCKLPHQNLDP